MGTIHVLKKYVQCIDVPRTYPCHGCYVGIIGTYGDLGIHSYHPFLRGKYEDAKALYERSLTISQKKLGPDHLEVGLSHDNMAMMLYEQVSSIYL